MEEAEARRLFKKLKIRTLLDLALTIPAGYEDTRLCDRIEPGKTQTFEAVVRQREERGGRMSVRFDLPALGRPLTGIFFRATPYHRKLFEPGSRHVIHGKISLYNGWPQMAQPRSLKRYGELLPRYKTLLKESEMQALAETFLTERALYAEGLESPEVETLLWLHFPGRYGRGVPDPSSPELREVLKFVEAYNHLRKLRAKRHDYPALKALKGDLEPFVRKLPFELTAEQKETIEALRKDLAREDRAARRMVIGDVGSGKTMVILAAAMIAGKDRSLLMAPTSILARQLYEEA